MPKTFWPLKLDQLRRFLDQDQPFTMVFDPEKAQNLTPDVRHLASTFGKAFCFLIRFNHWCRGSQLRRWCGPKLNPFPRPAVWLSSLVLHFAHCAGSESPVFSEPLNSGKRQPGRCLPLKSLDCWNPRNVLSEDPLRLRDPMSEGQGWQRQHSDFKFNC